jgi:hypothetical protein
MMNKRPTKTSIAIGRIDEISTKHSLSIVDLAYLVARGLLG